jgi:dienelactone hydrolase
MRAAACCIALALLAAMAAQAEQNVLAGEVTVNGETFSAEEMLPRYLKARGDAAIAAANGRFTSGVTPGNLAERQASLRALFIQQLGGFPERTPLNPRITGTGVGEGFRYEKLIYESLPGHYVTAALFLPETPGPYPAVLVPCGHSDNGKAAETYQRACISLARNGIAALVHDPIGQGERYLYFSADGAPIPGGTTIQHTVAGVGCILTGTNIAMYHIWDGMRGLDYLESRPDIDASRLACSGNSGGGTLTSYLMALDDRVSVAAPSCYITSFDRLLHTIGPQDAEQNIFGQLTFGMGHAEYLLMRAPKPTLICAAQGDFFDIGGTWDTFREVKTAYSFLGAPQHLDLAVADDKHGFSKPLREAMVRWMRRWLLDIDEPYTEPDFAILTDAEIQASPEGQVAKMDGVKSVVDFSIERAEKLAAAREGGDTLAAARKLYEAMRPGADLGRNDMIVERSEMRDESHVFTVHHEDEASGQRVLPHRVVEADTVNAFKGTLLLFLEERPQVKRWPSRATAS